MTVPSRQADEALERLIDYAGWATTPKPHKDAVATVRDALERLREERDEYAERLAWHREERDAYLKGNLWVGRAAEERARAEAAEAEVRRLTEGLRELLDAFPMADPYGSLWEDYRKAQDKDRALLSSSPTDGGGA